MKVKTSTWNSPMAHFIGGGNTIKVCSKQELEQVKALLLGIGIDMNIDWDKVRKPNGYLCLEYQLGKGSTFYTDEKNSIDWYGEEPFTINDIFE